MRFLVILPAERAIQPFEAKEVHEVYPHAGLKDMEVDHGIIMRNADGIGLGIVVYEYGLYSDPMKQSYFALAGKLYAGNAVLYGFDQGGDTIDAPPADNIKIDWFLSAHDVEQAIRDGFIERPRVAVNNAVIWQWPDRNNPMMGT